VAKKINVGRQTYKTLIVSIWKRYHPVKPSDAMIKKILSVARKTKRNNVKGSTIKLGTFISWWTRQYALAKKTKIK